MTGHENCEYCSIPLEERKKLVPFHYMGKVIYFEDVPVWICQNCGYLEFSAEVYKKLEEMAKEAGNVTEKITFPLVRFA